jgi:hypothetical protein
MFMGLSPLVGLPLYRLDRLESFGVLEAEAYKFRAQNNRISDSNFSKKIPNMPQKNSVFMKIENVNEHLLKFLYS